MFEYKEILTSRSLLGAAISYWQNRGWEVVSHAMYSPDGVSLLFRREKEHAVEQ